MKRVLLILSVAIVASSIAFAAAEGETTASGSSGGLIEVGPGPLAEGGRWATPTDYENSTGLTLGSFSESPMLAALVSSGDLPPVEDRVSAEPLVAQPLHGIGKYSEQLNVTARADVWGPQSYGHLEPMMIRTRPTLASVLPNILKELEVSDDLKTFTLHLRKGMKWSDGASFTTDDFMFFYNDILQNTDLTPSLRAPWVQNGEIVQFSQIDDTTIRYSYSVPVPAMKWALSSRWGVASQTRNGAHQPAHYLKQFHIGHNDKAGDLAKAAGFDEWYQLFQAKRQYNDDGYAEGLPVVDAWHVSSVTLDYVITPRNPYYWKVDTAGNQLPYFDRIVGQVIDNNELVAAKAISGEQDIGSGIYGGSMTIDKFPVFMQNAAKNDYKVSIEPTGHDAFAFEVGLFFNHTYPDAGITELFNTPKFKYALSHAINRDEVNDLVFAGIGTPRGAAIQAQAAYGYLEGQTAHIEYNPDAANKLLDELGLKVGADGNRTRPDGSPLQLIITHAGDRRAAIPPTLELVLDHWADVGINAMLDDAGPRGGMWQKYSANEAMISTWGVDGSDFASTKVRPGWWGRGQFWGRKWQEWYASDGLEGEEPTAAAREFIDAWYQIPGMVDEEAALQVGKAALENLAENMWFMGIVAPAPDVRFHRNDMRGVDLERLPPLVYGWSGAWTWSRD